MYELGFRNTRSGFFLPAFLPLLALLLAVLSHSCPRAAALTQPPVDAPTPAWQLIWPSPACPISSSMNAGSLKRQDWAWGYSPPLILALLALQLIARNPSDPWLSCVAHTLPCLPLSYLDVTTAFVMVSDFLEPANWTLMKCKQEDKSKTYRWNIRPC